MYYDEIEIRLFHGGDTVLVTARAPSLLGATERRIEAACRLAANAQASEKKESSQ